MIIAGASIGGKLKHIFGAFHSLLSKLQETVIVTAKHGALKI
jgi:hypothetical protein